LACGAGAGGSPTAPVRLTLLIARKSSGESLKERTLWCGELQPVAQQPLNSRVCLMRIADVALVRFPEVWSCAGPPQASLLKVAFNSIS
jgi:hypothetical protein